MFIASYKINLLLFSIIIQGTGQQNIINADFSSCPDEIYLNSNPVTFTQSNCKRINIEVFGPNKRGLNFYEKNDYIVRDMIVSKQI